MCNPRPTHYLYVPVLRWIITSSEPVLYNWYTRSAAQLFNVKTKCPHEALCCSTLQEMDLNCTFVMIRTSSQGSSLHRGETADILSLNHLNIWLNVPCENIFFFSLIHNLECVRSAAQRYRVALVSFCSEIVLAALHVFSHSVQIIAHLFIKMFV